MLLLRYRADMFTNSGWTQERPGASQVRQPAAALHRRRLPVRSLHGLDLQGPLHKGYFGFIAHYDTNGFYDEQLSTPERRNRFLKDLADSCERDAHLGRPDLWSDVKAVLIQRQRPPSQTLGAPRSLWIRKDENVSHPPLHSDRVNGPVARDLEKLSEATANGLLGYVQSVIDMNWVADEFPERCSDRDKQHIFSTNTDALESRLLAIIPELQWPLRRNKDELTDDQLFDLLEYIGRFVALPQEGAYHSYFDHSALSFDRRAGAVRYHEEVNELLGRGGAAFTMATTLIIERLGPPELRATLSALNPASGDEQLDELIEHGRKLYTSRKMEERLAGLQALWGAFQRLKTLDVPGRQKKRLSAETLLGNIQSEPLRDVVRADMVAVSNLGNDFRIRHHETDTAEVPVDAYDYFAGRVTTVLLLLLAQSDRLDA